MKLYARVDIPFSREPYLALIESGDGPYAAPATNRAVISSHRTPCPEVTTVFAPLGEGGAGAIRLPPELSYLGPGDIVRVDPRAGEVRVLFRKSAADNCFLLTERCNSRCVMCPQPPRSGDDSYLVDELLTALLWISKDTAELGLSGGEPTLLGARLIEVLRSAAKHLPRTALHVLSNGRRFAEFPLAEAVASVGHPDLVFGIPLYGDVARVHDFVVQANGAFDETMLGLANLGRVGLAIEIRVVLHRWTVARLPLLARFIRSNLPFVNQVVFMGLELMGFARSNAAALWMAPADYESQLTAAVQLLDDFGIDVRIYGHPLCVLPESLRTFARNAISSWKLAYDQRCGACAAHAGCGGAFESSAGRFSPLIRPLAQMPRSASGSEQRLATH